MGLGLHLRADLGQAAWKEGSVGPLSEIAAAGLDSAEAHGLRAFFSALPRGNKLHLRLHPAAEPVEFALLEGGTLECDAKTSTLGPGYHQYAVQVIEAIGARLGILWLGGLDEDADDTGYFADRDFGRLQREMSVLLAQLAPIVVERLATNPSGLMVNMPISSIAGLPEGVATPLGIFPGVLFQEAADAGFVTDEFARHFYPWWDEGLTAETWRNFGLVDLWSEVFWRPPSNEFECATCERALQSFAHARRLDSSLPMPDSEIAELRTLLAADPSSAVVPAAGRIGYRRYSWKHEHFGWAVEVPGYFYERLEADGTQEVFWYGEREIWCTSFTLEPAKPVNLHDLRSDLKPDSLTVLGNDFVGCANITEKQFEDGWHGCTMSCVFRAPGSTAVITIIYAASDREWAEQTFRRIGFDPKGAGQE